MQPAPPNHSQCAQSEDSRKGHLLASRESEAPHHVKRHAKYDEIERHIRPRDRDPVRFQVDALVREEAIDIVPLGLCMALESQAQKRGNKPRNADETDYQGYPLKVESVEDAAVEEEDRDLDHGDGETVGDHSGLECLSSTE